MFEKILGTISKDIGLDLGTSNTRVYLKDKGIMMSEPSIVAINKRQDQIITLGQNALKMEGKVPSHIEIVRPLRHGVISDFEVTEKMLKSIFEKVHRDVFALVSRPTVIASVPLDVTEVEQKSLEDVILQAGAKQVYLVQRSMAAAIGARLPVQESIGSLVVEIGGGLTEIAVLSLNGIVEWKSLKIGSESFDKRIISFVREEFGVLLGGQTAARLKHQIGSAFKTDKNQEMSVRGRDLRSGLPKEIIVTESQIREAIMPLLNTIIESVHDTIESSPPELVSDIYERGIMLSGGGAMLQGFEKLVKKKVEVPVYITNEPSTSVIRGIGYILEDFDNLKPVLIPSARE